MWIERSQHGVLASGPVVEWRGAERVYISRKDFCRVVEPLLISTIGKRKG